MFDTRVESALERQHRRFGISVPPEFNQRASQVKTCVQGIHCIFLGLPFGVYKAQKSGGLLMPPSLLMATGNKVLTM